MLGLSPRFPNQVSFSKVRATRAPILRVVRVWLRRDARARTSAGQRTGTGLPSTDAAVTEAVGGTNPCLANAESFWQARYYDFNVWSEGKFVEKLRYIHRNPVVRGLVGRPEDWPWSSFRHYLTSADGVVEIESQWTARRRERRGIIPMIRIRSDKESPAQAKLERGTLKSRFEG